MIKDNAIRRAKNIGLKSEERKKIEKGRATYDDFYFTTNEQIERICGDVLSEKDYYTIEEEVIKFLQTGHRLQRIIDWIVINYPNVDKQRAKHLVDRVRLVMAEEYDAYIKDVCRENIQTLINIRNEALANGQKHAACEAIDMINKMTGQYTQKEDIKVTNINQEPIQIKFN